MKAALIGIAALALPLPALAQATPAAGTMMKTAPLAADHGLADAGKALSILYSSTDGVTGKGTVPVSGALFLPKGKPPKGGWPLVAWAHGTVGIGDDCAPSRNARSQRDATYLNSWLREGYAVVATDYQGLGTPGPHPYLNTRAEAYSVLDSVRAALGAKLGLANKVLIIGQSQGAGAAFATAGYAQAYAPKVNLLGTVATGVPYLNGSLSQPSDIDQVDRTIAYLMYIAAAAQEVDPALKADAAFTPEARPLVAESEKLCVAEMMGAVVKAGLTRRKALVGDFSALYAPYLRGTGYSTVHIRTPVFIGTGEKDVDVPPPMQKSLVRDACKAGTRIQFHLYKGMDHSGALNPSFADSRVFARNLLEGKPVSSNCGTPDAE
ncbi:alpha/beta fold hydrolase [Sphingomonas sp.]|uniref:alpha/beta fold hydrolase n=1 Tax=Sphingomonas sp. TaxID=28214 RepID=UPI0035AE036E